MKIDGNNHNNNFCLPGPPEYLSPHSLIPLLVNLDSPLHAGSFLCEWLCVHPSLRTVEGALSILWWFLRKDKGVGGLEEVRILTLKRLEEHETI